MKQTQIIMGMPITVDAPNHLEQIFSYFRYVDAKYSPFKPDSDVSQLNMTPELKLILQLCDQTKSETNGYFDVWHNGKLDPSGLVKGWAINNAAKILENFGHKNFYIEAGGDIQANGKTWKVGIRNPFNKAQYVKVLKIKNKGVATSGNYERGQHIYNPKSGKIANGIASITVIGPNIYEADRFATAAFAMGEKGIHFIENLKHLAGYQINLDKKAVMTTSFHAYVD